MDIAIFQGVLFSSFLIFLAPKNLKYWISLLIVLLLIIVTSSWAVTALSLGVPVEKNLLFEFWDTLPHLVIDKLSAFFILVVNFTILTGTIYAKGYLKPYYKTKTSTSLSKHYFSLVWLHAAMLQVTMFRSGLPFLLVWEIMSVTSFLLVIFEGNKENVLKIGINYLIQMHLGFGFILVGFFILEQGTGTMSFDSLATYFSTNSNFWLFIIFFVGFGIKAGFIPLHSWLPHAHPAAPSHVSGIMSGVMIKMGIYGILRVLTHVQANFMEIGSAILIVSLISGLLGVLLAIFQHDLKKLLAYHSIENIGIIGIGIGVALLGKHFGNNTLVYLGLGGGLLHVLNHSLFKSALFYSAGNVYQATHTRNIEQLGGLMKRMPYTGMLFLISALAICGIPPFNGFISEFLIYNGVFQNLTHAGYTNSLISVATIVSLALIGGLALFCFTKAFGVAFLGVRRQVDFEEVTERPISMILPGIMIVFVILFIGFFPSPFFGLIYSINSEFSFVDTVIPPVHTTHLTLVKVGLINFVFTALVIFFIALRYIRQKSVTVTTGPTWGCGYTAGDFKHQYTSTSYANNLRQIAQPIIGFNKKYSSFKETDLFPPDKEFHVHVDDRIERDLIIKPANWLKDILPKAGMAQTGSIHHYLLYPVVFMIIIGLITYFNFI